MARLVPESWLQPQSLQDIMMKQAQFQDVGSQRQARERQLAMAEHGQPFREALLQAQTGNIGVQQGINERQLQLSEHQQPFKEALLQAQTKRAETPSQPNVWEQQFNEFERIAKGRGMQQKDIDNAKGLFLLQKMAGGGQTTQVDIPGGGGVTIGRPGASGMGSLYEVFGGKAPSEQGIQPTKSEQTSLEKQMRGVEQASEILPEVIENIKYKHPVHAAMADTVGFLETFAPALTEAAGLTGSKGLAKYNSALGKVKEKLTTAYGLRSTDKTNADVQKIIEGARYEKPEDAKQRIHQLMIELRSDYERNASHLISGYAQKMEGKPTLEMKSDYKGIEGKPLENTKGKTLKYNPATGKFQ